MYLKKDMKNFTFFLAFKKVTFICYSWFEKKYLEELKKGLVKYLNEILIGKTTGSDLAFKSESNFSEKTNFVQIQS